MWNHASSVKNMISCSSLSLLNWSFNRVQKLQCFFLIWMPAIPQVSKYDMDAYHPLVRYDKQFCKRGQSVDYDTTQMYHILTQFAHTIVIFSSNVRVDGHSTLCKSNSVYSMQNLSMILFMVESAGIVTFGNSCQNRILMVM